MIQSCSTGDGAFVVSERSHRFIQRAYPKIALTEWVDWRWHMRNRVQTLADFERLFKLSASEAHALGADDRRFSAGITPYFASLLSINNAADPLRRTVLPTTDEWTRSNGDRIDPLAEDVHTPVPGIVHRYPDRVLFLATDYCPVYCRYCTRSRLVGGGASERLTRRLWQNAIDYIAATPAIHDVLISGGDPLVNSDERLAWLLQQLHAIPHLDFIRIGTKFPIALPQRITPPLVRILKQFHPLYMSIHVIHPSELTEEAAEACERLADAGIPLGSQTVLLRGINDNIVVMRDLVRRLLRVRIKPYYLLQCDPITGSGHLRTPVQTGIDIIRGLRGHVSGYAVPHFIVDVPDGGGKISLVPEYITGHDGAGHVITNFQGRSGFHYPDPAPLKR